MWYYILAVIVLLLDQGTKWLVATRMELGEQIPVIGDFFAFYSHRNRGAAFGILQDQRWFFIVTTIIVVIGIIWYMRKVRHQPGFALPLGLSLILGGAIGNFIDRLLTGEVVDFFRFNFGSYTFPIFNVADIAICVGVAFVMLDAILEIKREREMEKQIDGSKSSDGEQ
ncbi:signal peptidase II [Paenibacillus sp. 481]|uniref:signal peptidase II n=1 Tax=Paenibacillus sp. 481 TaxID=2835869 RepID=UPI001E2DB472|nr:signal peptidase II [Paenibacillus sp. 481]UHA74108.1 signal peptidase II [Paenibacillus sp. 481]